MPLPDMKPKERWLASTRLQPVDRLLFYPKINAAYAPSQQGAFKSMTRAEMFDWIGADRHEWVPAPISHRQTRGACEVRKTDSAMAHTYRAAGVELEDKWAYDPGSCSWHPVEFAIKTPEDIAVMTEIFRDRQTDIDTEALEKARDRYAAIGDDAVVAAGIGTTALMDVLQHLAGIENTHFFLMTHPQEMQDLFNAMDAVLRRRAELLAETQVADIYYIVENTSTTLISPEQYRRFCKPCIAGIGDLLGEADCILTLHMCGFLKALLPDLNEVGAQVFEAFTSPPVGDTPLQDGREQCPDVCLFGGTNATLWLQPPERIVAEIERDLAALPHRRGIILSSAGVMPPACPPEAIRQVCRWIHSCPAPT